MMKKLLLGAAALAAFAVSAPAQALVVGTAQTSSTIPFANSTFPAYYFQQVYAASNFDGAINLSGLTFFNTKAPDQDVSPAGNFKIFLSVVNTDIATFDTSNGLTVPYNDPSFTKVFDGVLPTLAGSELNIDFLKSFNYDPSQGQLLVTILSTDLSTGTLYLDVDNKTTVTNSRWSAYGYDWNQGLVTGFNAAVPEPGTWALMIAGFGMAGGTLRRRRTLAA